MGRASRFRGRIRLRWRDLGVQLPLVLVMGSLVSVALLPMMLQGRISASLNEISEVVEPIHRSVDEIQLALALEAAGTRGFLLTGDERYAASHRKARMARARAYARLVDSAPLLDPDFRAAVVELGDRLRPADALLDALFTGQLTGQQYMLHLSDQQNRFETVIAATADVQQAISGDELNRRNKIGATQRAGTLLTLGIVLLALTAVVAVARLGARHRALAMRERKARAAMEEAQVEAELRRQEVERVSASRERLMRGFSHDVRNPLGAAEGYLWMLEQGVMNPLTSKQSDAVGKSRRSIKAALKIIEDLLELARGSAGEVELHRGPVDLRAVAIRAAEDYSAQAGSKGLALEWDIPAAFPIVQSDIAKVSEILGNVIGNAIKYTQRGSVTVGLGIRQDDSGSCWAVVEVSDTGPGIPADEHELIFAEFHRLPAVAGTSGVGIGLAISQQMAKALGGRVTVDSEVGRGSTFSLWLPLDPSASAHVVF